MKMAMIGRNLWENKEGLLGGAVTGFLVGLWAISQGYDTTFTLTSQGVFDSVTVMWDAAKVANWKFLTGLMLIGSFFGYVIDSLVPEMTFKKIKRMF